MKFLKKIWDRLKKSFSKIFANDIGIDLGTANTLVYASSRGIVIDEPSVVAVNRKTGQVVAVGEGAKKMLGRTPSHIEAVRPLVDGVISDFEVTQEMLSYLINKAQKDTYKIIGPRVLVGVPSGITNVETRAVKDAVRNAGAREVYIIEEPMAAAVGHKLPVRDAVGSVVVDIGGGTTDIVVISLGGVVNAKSLRIAGDKFNEDIISYVRDEFKILIGEKTAEDIKIKVGSLIPEDNSLETTMKGRDLVTGLPKELIVTDADVREAIAMSVDTLLESIKEVLETTPPEIISDVIKSGIYITGGGALIRGFDKLIEQATGVPVHIIEEPLTAVARGTGVVLENIPDFQEVLIDDDNDAPIRD